MLEKLLKHVIINSANVVSHYVNKNDDSVKEAPAYCRSFLDGLYNTKEVGDGAKPLL